MQPGCYDDIPEKDYHASPGVSVSRLKRHRKAPILATVDTAETREMRLGTLIHTAILEPGRLHERFTISDMNRNKNEFKALEAAEKAAGREVIKQEEMDAALHIRDSAMGDPDVREILTGGPLATEQSFYWIDPTTGLLCRGRCDAIRLDAQVCIDLKSAQDASPDEWCWAAGRYRYDWQEAFYRQGIEATCGWSPRAFVFVVVEKVEPWIVQSYILDPDHVAAAYEEVAAELAAYRRNQETGEWPAFGKGLMCVPVRRKGDGLGWDTTPRPVRLAAAA